MKHLSSYYNQGIGRVVTLRVYPHHSKESAGEIKELWLDRDEMRLIKEKVADLERVA